jgi:hypothetical protein
MGDSDTPANGDVSICFHCASVSIFDDTREEGLRRPTPAERQEIANTADIQRALAAWRMQHL